MEMLKDICTCYTLTYRYMNLIGIIIVHIFIADFLNQVINQWMKKISEYHPHTLLITDLLWAGAHCEGLSLGQCAGA